MRPKKVVLFPEISQVNIFLSPTHWHKSNVYESNYFQFKKKHTHTHTQISLANLFIQIYIFFPSKDRALCFSRKKSAVEQFFKCKLYLKNLIKLIKHFFTATRVKIFVITCISRNKNIIFFGLRLKSPFKITRFLLFQNVNSRNFFHLKYEQRAQSF